MIVDTQNLPVASLLKFFERFFPLNQVERKEVIARFTKRSVKRRAFILQQGDVAKYFTFVVSGCFRQYIIDDSGKEYNLQFAIENDWITDLCSFYSEDASNTYVEALEPSVILQIKHEDLLYLYTHYHKFDRNFRIIVEKKYIDLQNRVMQNISVTAENRYQNFLTRYPDLASRLPNIHIASYLGITPEFLSKVRKKMVRPA